MCEIPVGQRSGSQLAMTSVATIIDILFFSFFFLSFSSPSSTFLNQKNQKTYLAKVDGIALAVIFYFGGGAVSKGPCAARLVLDSQTFNSWK